MIPGAVALRKPSNITSLTIQCEHLSSAKYRGSTPPPLPSMVWALHLPPGAGWLKHNSPSHHVRWLGIDAEMTPPCPEGADVAHKPGRKAPTEQSWKESWVAAGYKVGRAHSLSPPSFQSASTSQHPHPHPCHHSQLLSLPSLDLGSLSGYVCKGTILPSASWEHEGSPGLH